jgi:hypothetical protein
MALNLPQENTTVQQKMLQRDLAERFLRNVDCSRPLQCLFMNRFKGA